MWCRAIAQAVKSMPPRKPPVRLYENFMMLSGKYMSDCVMSMFVCMPRFTVVTWNDRHNTVYTEQQQQHPFNHPLSGTPHLSWYQKGKTSLDLLKQETLSGSGISWAICKSSPWPREITMPAAHHSVFTGRIPFLLLNLQLQSTEGTLYIKVHILCISVANSKTVSQLQCQ